MDAANPPDVDAALRTERQFVLTLGGLVLEVAGARLVTHERLPVPRFNFVEEIEVGPERQSAFFERALDHYFQRALRPTFRVRLPVSPHIDAGLRRFGFTARAAPLVLFLSNSPTIPPGRPAGTVRPATSSELDLVASFWTAAHERAEFRAALDVAWTHPNAPERLQPLLAFRDGEAISAALIYRYRQSAGIYAVATRPDARGLGGASDIVQFTTTTDPVGPGVRYSIFADSSRLESHLRTLGFSPARSFQEYELSSGAELTLAPAGPAGPPRWRPPRPRKGSGG
jgi:hypothetical protein